MKNIVVIAALLLAVIPSQGALSSYMWITDDAGKQVNGSVVIDGRQNSVEVLAWDHDVAADLITGGTAAAVVHTPLTVTKRIDAATPLLYRAVCEGATLQTVHIKTYRIDDTGTETEFYQCTMEGVRVVAVEPTLNNIRDRKKVCVPTEDISLMYTKITWTFLDGNVSASAINPVH